MIGNGLALMLAGTVSGLLIIGAAPFPDWHSLVTDFGFPIALVLFFVWNTWKREERLSERITRLEDFQQRELMELNKAAVSAIAENTAALNRLVAALEARPCLCEGGGLVEKMQTLTDHIARLAPHAQPRGNSPPQPG